ncbi:MAG: triose-phosphate isomerase [Alphaproteobacteria bacterium]|nr:triose-phosphate isomerase [Alphaproteobacteria bacterium]
MKKKKLIAGNWKMNGSLDDAKGLIADLINGLFGVPVLKDYCDFVVFPPYLHLYAIRHALHGREDLLYGGQDCSMHDNGAYTGDTSAAMLKDSGCSYVILGHSERRHGLGETSETICEKAKRVHESGLIAIICVGETEEEREQGRAQEVVNAQIEASMPEGSMAENTVIAYEPVWAIGTGKTATPEDVKEMHAFIREKLAGKLENAADLRILYGGSMKPENARQLLATENVDGGLIGGASLNAQQFLDIAKAALA